MKSLSSLTRYSHSLTLSADELLEFHASRLMLLIMVCGTKNSSMNSYRIDGLTKLAKLDFFVRYPEFFERAARALGREVTSQPSGNESKMIRFHYGPWDKRYYQVLPFLEARGLIAVKKKGSTYSFLLTEKGIGVSERLANNDSFEVLLARMREVKEVMSPKTGTQLKELVYELFKDEVANKNLNELI